MTTEHSHSRTCDLGNDWFATLDVYTDGSSELTLRNSEIGRGVSIKADCTAKLREFLDAARNGTLR